MTEFMDKYNKTMDTWRWLLDNVNAYVFGEEFNEEMFADAMKGAFDIYSKMYSLEMMKIEDYCEPGANHFLALTGILFEYAADRYVADSENEVFRASQLAVRLLLGRIANDYMWHEDGILPAIELDYWFESDRELVYDVNKGDLSDMIEVVRLI